MSASTAVGLLSGILLAMEQRGEEDPVDVLPVVHDDLKPEQGLLAAFAERLGGVYVDVDGRSPGADGPLNESLAAITERICAESSLPITVTEDAGRVIATSADHEEPTGGVYTALRVIELLVSGEIDRSWVAISYPLAGLDTMLARMLWQLTAVTISDAPPPSLGTFIPIAAGDVSVSRHCLPHAPVRFAVHQGRLIRRGSTTHLEAALDTILTDAELPLVLFLGAGASASAEISLGDTVRDQAIADLTGHDIGSPDLVGHFREWLARHPDRWMEGEQGQTVTSFARSLTLERVLREEFWALSGRPREASRTVVRMRAECDRALDRMPLGRAALHRLADKLPRLVVITVNFDQLIEDQLDHPHQVVAGPDAFEEHRQLVIDRATGQTEVLPILKVHGTIERADTLVADINDTSRGLPRQVVDTFDALLDEVGAVAWVWVGCSMRDEDVKQWLRRRDTAERMAEFFVDPLPGPSLFEYARREREARWALQQQQTLEGHRLITETSDTFLSALDLRADVLRA
jgi:hypothetical protein